MFCIDRVEVGESAVNTFLFDCAPCLDELIPLMVLALEEVAHSCNCSWF